MCKQVVNADKAATKIDQCIMELTREQAAALLLLGDNVSIKLKAKRSEIEETRAKGTTRAKILSRIIFYMSLLKNW